VSWPEFLLKFFQGAGLKIGSGPAIRI